MSFNSLAVQLFIVLLAVYLLFLIVAFWRQRTKQRIENEAWLERYFAAVRADRERRDKLGRFLPKKFL